MPDWQPAVSRREDASGEVASPIVQAAQKLTARIEGLVREMEELRADNASLRREVRDAVAVLERAGRAAPETKTAGGRGRRRTATPAPVRRRRRKQAKGRATPPSVTGEVVKAVLAKLGSATASEVAREITTAGAPVSGRAIRFLAERAGAHTFMGEDGQRRYRL